MGRSFKLQDFLSDGKVVSTVKLSYPINGGIYETLVFPNQNNFTDLDSDRYMTRDEAKRGHKKMINKWSVKSLESEK